LSTASIDLRRERSTSGAGGRTARKFGVLIPAATWAAIERGEVTLAFRRWRRPTVKTGGTLRRGTGVLAIDEVAPVTEDEITEADARASGAASRDALLAFLHKKTDGDLYRVRLRYQGADPRIALRQQAELSDEERSRLVARLDRLDRASTVGPWTRASLRIIERRPAVRAGDLAEELGFERLPWKANVRKLKELGLTESLEVGYRLSPRGQAFLATLADDDDQDADTRTPRS
jgi:hypothetical protein